MQLQSSSRKLIGLLFCAALLSAGLLASRRAVAQGNFWTPQAILKDMFAHSERVGYVEVSMRSAADSLRAVLGYLPQKAKYNVFVAQTGSKIDGYAVLDEERGQHLPIHFAVQLDAEGRVVRTEVLSYAEAYGEEIREPRFRQQFVGKQPSDSLRLGNDVVAISGATLSSRAMTLAVKRAVALVQWVRAHPAQ